MFGEHNLDNKATFQLSYNLVDTTPPMLDMSGVQITEDECNGGDNHDIGPIIGVHASDMSCKCSHSHEAISLQKELQARNVFITARAFLPKPLHMKAMLWAAPV
jgi:hypothetical protein